MRLGALAVIRLKRTFWHRFSSCSLGRQGSAEALRVGVQNTDYRGWRGERQTLVFKLRGVIQVAGTVLLSFYSDSVALA
jgi:hypothetical protein